ncbi:MAG TPA: TauD/TfdA family dioxygenase [Myxococcota bacterium]|nr:TauD/TfdA family dioxygenase [Myxococcota bacterium]
MSRLDEAKTAPLSGSLGTLVSGLDLRKDLDAATVAELRALFLERLVLVFPDQHLSPDEQRALMRHFGEVEKHPERPRVLEDSDEEVVIITPAAGVSAVWHCDYQPDFLPCGICSLNMVETAADGGGDTIFVNAYRIYESFSEPVKRLLDGLTAIHRNTGNAGRNRDEAWFPLVGTHPETGRKGLFYSAHHVQDFVELVPEDAAMLLARLQQLTQKPSFSLRYHWSPGAIAVWDNRAVQHYVVPDFAGSRLLYQVTVSADLLIPLPDYEAPSESDRAVAASEIDPR